MKIKFDKKFLELGVLKKVSGGKRIKGLMFKKPEKAEALLFEFDKPVKLKIHSCFVFFPFLAIWLDDKNRVVCIKIVKPFRFSVSPKTPFCKLIEIPLTRNYNSIVGIFLSQFSSISGK